MSRIFRLTFYEHFLNYWQLKRNDSGQVKEIVNDANMGICIVKYPFAYISFFT